MPFDQDNSYKDRLSSVIGFDPIKDSEELCDKEDCDCEQELARPGPKSAAQTPAPPKERIKGSKENPEGTAATRSKAGDIEISEANEQALKDKIAEFKKDHPQKNAPSLGTLKKVFRRGAGAFSTSFRPTITGGKPNSRNAWAMARVNKFLKMAGGGEVKESYRKADGDLLEERFEDCGTGAGGFKEGNTCASGGGGAIKNTGDGTKNRKTVGSSIWGSSKSNSFQMAGYSAKLMGVEGFKYKEEWNSPKALKTDTVKILDAINNDKIGSEEPTFHGFQNIQNKQFKIGESVKIPLTATASDIESAEGYGIERLRQNQKGKPTIYEFPKGTKIAPYSVNKTKDDIESFGIYGEAITSGEFKISDIKKRTIEKWYEDTQRYEPLEIDVITLKQSKTFNPKTNSWN